MKLTEKIIGDGSKPRGKGSKAASMSEKAELQFPVGRIKRFLKTGKYASRISSETPVYLAGVLEFLATKVLELAGKEAKKEQETRITPLHIKMAVEQDENLSKLLGNVVFRN